MGMNHLKIKQAGQGSIRKFANIYFNRQCLQKHMIPKYARVKVPNTSSATKFTQHKVYNLRIKYEIKYLQMKKRQLNRQIYHFHVSLANTWGNTWHYIQQTIEEKLKKTPKDIHTFYPRVVNNTSITFTTEFKLLEKGFKYNLHSQKKNWLTTLALEVETAITLLSITDRDYYRKQVADRIEKLHNNLDHHNNTHPETRTLKSIQTKLKHKDAMIASADKGNSIVILPKQQYEAKILDFIDKNNF